MKFHARAMSELAVTASAFVIPSAYRPPTATCHSRPNIAMEEGAAPPPDMAETAMAAIDNIMRMCPDDMDPPASMRDLKQAIGVGDSLEIGEKMYWVLIENTLEYDIIDGMMQKVEIDFSKTEDPKVQEKMGYIYQYGISMFKRNLISEDALKDAVLGKLCARVGMDGPAFDKWLAVPAVQ